MKYSVVIRMEIEVDPTFPTPSKADVVRAIERGVKVTPTLRSVTEADGVSWCGYVGIPVVEVFVKK